MKTFSDLGLSKELVSALARSNITAPTPIQLATIPRALAGVDILASAQTGSGKTIAYLMPLLATLTLDRKGTALILVPTRELAAQVYESLRQFYPREWPLKGALLVGGAPMGKQLSDLRRGAQIVVGTPGRVTDHLERRTLSLNATRYLVVDEADRMLDMGFGVQLERIAEFLPEKRQTFMFSATLPPNIDRLSKKYLQNPEKISVDSQIAPPKIEEEFRHLKRTEKFTHLTKHLDQKAGSTIIFVKTKRGADQLADQLQELDHEAVALHGDLPQRKRDSVVRGFREDKFSVLVATDVAARGLDIPEVVCVINFDLPQQADDYTHRIGRTGRAGKEGKALSFVSPDEFLLFKAICRLRGIKMDVPDSHRREAGGPSKKYFSKKPNSFGKKPDYFKSRSPSARFAKPSRGE